MKKTVSIIIFITLTFFSTAQQPLTDSAKLKELDSVIVHTGYQKTPKERSTGSFIQLNTEQLQHRVSPDIMSRLENITSGLAFNKISGGSQTDISLRTRNTINSNADILIVVDNFPYEGNPADINPDDVESITVLKDAAAASIWGARAGNGVIVITTKAAKLNQKLKVDVNSNYTVTGKPDVFYLPQLSASNYIDIESYLFSKGKYDAQLNNNTTYPALSPMVELLAAVRSGSISQQQATAQTESWRSLDNRNDLLQYAYKPAHTRQLSLQASAGGANGAYIVSASYSGQQGGLGNTSQRITLRSQTRLTVFKKLDINMDISFFESTGKLATRPGSASLTPYEMLTDSLKQPVNNIRNYRPLFLQQRADKGFLNWSFNPLADAALNNNQNKRYGTRLAIALQYPIFKHFNITAHYQLQKELGSNRVFYSEDAYFTRNLINTYSQVNSTGMVIARPVPPGSILDKTQEEMSAANGRLQLNYNHSFGQHSINALAGTELRETINQSGSYRVYGYNNDVLTSKTVNYDTMYITQPAGSRLKIPNAPSPGSFLQNRYRSAFINVGYGYKSRYHLSGSIRKDASNLFGVAVNQRSVPLWSAGGKWDMAKETFFKGLPLSQFNLRATYGFSGNINKETTAFTTAAYSTNEFNMPAATITSPPNPDLRWERVSTLNLAIDMATKNKRILATVEFYYKRGLDLLAEKPMDPTTGAGNFTGNVANMKGQGVDLQLNAQWLNGPFTWSSTILLNYARDKVTSYFRLPTVSFMVNGTGISPVIGNPVFSIYSYAWAGLDAATGNPQGYVNKQVSSDYAKLVGTAVAPTDLVYHGPGRPPFWGSVINNFGYKNLSLSFILSYKAGYYFKTPSINYGNLVNNMQGHPDYMLRWQQPGDEKHTQVPSFIYPNPSANRDAFYNNSAVLVEKADQLRLQDIRLQYQLKPKKAYNSLLIYAYTNNMVLLWKANKKGLDPDYRTVAPAPFTLALGLMAGF